MVSKIDNFSFYVISLHCIFAVIHNYFSEMRQKLDYSLTWDVLCLYIPYLFFGRSDSYLWVPAEESSPKTKQFCIPHTYCSDLQLRSVIGLSGDCSHNLQDEIH